MSELLEPGAKVPSRIYVLERRDQHGRKIYVFACPACKAMLLFVCPGLVVRCTGCPASWETPAELLEGDKVTDPRLAYLLGLVALVALWMLAGRSGET